MNEAIDKKINTINDVFIYVKLNRFLPDFTTLKKVAISNKLNGKPSSPTVKTIGLNKKDNQQLKGGLQGFIDELQAFTNSIETE